MATASSRRPARPTFIQRLAALLAGIDQGVAWWGAHRAWPASEPARLDEGRR